MLFSAAVGLWECQNMGQALQDLLIFHEKSEHLNKNILISKYWQPSQLINKPMGTLQAIRGLRLPIGDFGFRDCLYLNLEVYEMEL